MKLFNKKLKKPLWKKLRTLARVFVLALFILASAIFLQNNIINVFANVENLRFNMSHLDFGLRFPSEQADKYFTVEFVGQGEPEHYTVAVYPKPKNEEDKSYCRANPDDYDKCYRDLCEHLAISSMDECENDTMASSSVSMADQLDTWQARLSAPAITGTVAQDHTGGIVTVNGEYGCDIAINIEENGAPPICGNNIIEEGEQCDNGSANSDTVPNACRTDCSNPHCGDGVIDSGEECDDNNNNSGDGCSSDCKIEYKTAGNGGGGGGGSTPLNLRDEKIACVSETAIVVTWKTNKYATGRVIYGEQSQSSIGPAPNYGYASSTKENADRVISHSATIENLTSNIYYFKPISRVSSDVFGKELFFDMSVCRPLVKGEAGFPELEITKHVDIDFANPGDTIAYQVSITNTGNLTAYNAILTDILPINFIFSEDGKTFKIWNLGDIAANQTVDKEYDVVIDESTVAGIYANLAQVSADNHNPVNAFTDLEVRTVIVNSAELTPTGFSIKEFVILISCFILLAGLIVVLRKKYL